MLAARRQSAPWRSGRARGATRRGFPRRSCFEQYFAVMVCAGHANDVFFTCYAWHSCGAHLHMYVSLSTWFDALLLYPSFLGAHALLGVVATRLLSFLSALTG